MHTNIHACKLLRIVVKSVIAEFGPILDIRSTSKILAPKLGLGGLLGTTMGLRRAAISVRDFKRLLSLFHLLSMKLYLSKHICIYPSKGPCFKKVYSRGRPYKIAGKSLGLTDLES